MFIFSFSHPTHPALQSSRLSEFLGVSGSCEYGHANCSLFTATSLRAQFRSHWLHEGRKGLGSTLRCFPSLDPMLNASASLCA